MNSLKRALERFNREEAPLAKARLIAVGENVVEIELVGPFYYECGAYSWVGSLLDRLGGEDEYQVEVVEEAPERIVVRLLLKRRDDVPKKAL